MHGRLYRLVSWNTPIKTLLQADERMPTVVVHAIAQIAMMRSLGDKAVLSSRAGLSQVTTGQGTNTKGDDRCRRGCNTHCLD